MQLSFIQVAFFSAFLNFVFIQNLCSQAYVNPQVKLMDIEWGLDGTPI